jgi:hypothetical protein
MNDKTLVDNINIEVFDDITNDIIKIFGSNEEYLLKNECRNILNIIFEALFDEKLKNKNFNYIFNLISKTNDTKINKEELEPVIRALIVCFDVNYITNSSTFNDKVCIKIGKHLLPITYYIKKNID